MVEPDRDIEFIATETEAEALLAEQSFIKQPPAASSTSGCATTSRTPTSAIALDEDFPRVYFTRERHRRGRAYFGPFSNAKRVRETLDLLGKVFQYRTCDGPEPGRAVGQPLPRLLHQALPGALRRLHLEGGVPREHRHDHRLPVGPLPPDRARPRAGDAARPSDEQEFEQAAEPAQPAARRCARCSSASGSRTRRWARSTRSRVAAEGTDANAQVFQVRDGVLADRQSFYLENAAAPRRGRGGGGVRAPVLRERAGGPAAGDRAARGRREHEHARGGARASAAARRWRCATPSAATSAASSSWPSATRASRSTRTGCAPSAAAAQRIEALEGLQRALGMEHDPDARSSASTSRT